MQLKYIILLNLLSKIYTFIHLKIVNKNKVTVYNNKNLLNIDNKIDKLYEEVNKLKKEKYVLLSNIQGLKMLNETEQNNALLNNKQSNINDTLNCKEELNNILPGIKIVFKQQSPYYSDHKESKSENFEIVKNNLYNFSLIGGCDAIKNELLQCSDMLVHFEKYKKFNVRTPKGLILEGLPGNGKTLLVKCFCGEINIPFIAVSGSMFQEKYVGVGSSRVRELFKLASDNKPCIIFIDEIDAIGRKRSDNDNPNSERDSTLNELLVCLDGFKSNDGIFIIGATNRADLLDPALVRPGRIDKTIFIGLPDAKTRKSIIDIHINGKPYDNTLSIESLIDITQGLSGAQIENLLNEALLMSLRSNKELITKTEIEFILNRILIGWQSNENNYSKTILYQIAIHEMGHAIVGLLSKDYNKLVKVTLNTWSPTTPGYTLFEINENENIYTKQKLLTKLTVLLGGRIAEEIFFGDKITTGASKDLKDVKSIAEHMVVIYGMGSKNIYPENSNKAKENIDNEITLLLDIAYTESKVIILNAKKLIDECATILVNEQTLTADFILNKIKVEYPHLL